MALQFIITDAGRAAIAQVGGAIGPVTLTKIAIGSGGYTPTASRTALQTEIKRLDPSGSSVPVPGTIHLTAQDDSADSYSVKEIGLYTNNNVLFAIYSQTGVILTKGSTASALFAMDFVMTNVPAGTVVVGDAGFSYAQANETRLGVLSIATTAEAQAGSIDTKIITPLKLASVTATETRRGLIQLATTAEAQALTLEATKALTVARLVDRTATTSRVGVVELADNTETQTGTDTARAVTPASLKSTLSSYSISSHTHAAAAIVSGTIDNARLTQATSGVAGIVELATDAETQTGTDAVRAVTPAGLASRTATDARAGIVELATNTETQSGTDTGRAVTPAGLASRTATDARAGIVELATNTETQSGTSTALAVTPAGLKTTLSGYAASTHTHGNISNVGAIGTTANLPVITGTNGVLQASSFGTAANTFCQGNDTRLAQATSSAAGIVELATDTETQAGTSTSLAVTPASLASRTATDTRSGLVELATNAETQAGTDAARAVTPASLASAAALFVPPGAVMPFAMSTAPSGWVPADNRELLKTGTYAALFSAIGTLYGQTNGAGAAGTSHFRVPDLRGYFVRGSGTNADGTAAGTFGAKQADAFQGHRHSSSSSAQRVTYGSVIATGGGWAGEAQGTSVLDPTTDGTNGTPRTASETRPKNIALLYCIKI